jgi:IgGFc binding protein
MKRARHCLWIGTLLLLAAACGSSSNNDLNSHGPQNCSPGDTRTCVGPGACPGGQQCGANGQWSPCDCGAGGTGGNAGGSGGIGGASGNSGSDGTAGKDGGLDAQAGAAGQGGVGGTGNPTTCAQAASAKSYLGCDFYPTVVANNVWSIFDYAVIVANAGAATASVTVTGNGVQQSVTVPPNGVRTIYLPWVPALKGPDTNECGTVVPLAASVLQPKGAYHLVSSAPVAVYQFNALEYQPSGGPSGKDWSSCPGSQVCSTDGMAIGCFSYSNDASLLLPTTALTGDYRVTGETWTTTSGMTTYFAVTATADGTSVQVHLSQTGQVVAGGGVTATPAGGVLNLSLDQGDVAEVVAPAGTDLSGSLVHANKPVQVISGVPCIGIPSDGTSCDHIEESVLPAETLGKHYFVAPPTGPLGDAPGYVVRFYGNVDGTTLSYPSGAPPSAPTTLSAGQVVDLGQITQAFEVTGNHAFAISTFMLGGAIVDPNAATGAAEGDPSQSQAVPVEQYRSKYVFLAPSDYDLSYADVIAPSSAHVTLDGSPLTGANSSIGSGYLVVRAKLGAGVSGAHVLTSDVPVGLQVLGYGQYTSYQYPGGLNLTPIAPPPTN